MLRCVRQCRVQACFNSVCRDGRCRTGPLVFGKHACFPKTGTGTSKNRIRLLATPLCSVSRQGDCQICNLTEVLKPFTEEWKRRVPSQRLGWFGSGPTLNRYLISMLKTKMSGTFPVIPFATVDYVALCHFEAYGEIRLACQS